MYVCKIKTLSLQERVLRRTNISGESECWEWKGPKGRNGYGMLSIGCKNYLAHRKSYEAFIGPIPAGNHFGTMCVCHRCDNRACVNPAHLFLGTVQDNNADKTQKGRNVVIPMCGTDNPNAKLTELKVRQIRHLDFLGTPRSALAKRFAVAFQTIHKIVRGEKWKHIPLPPYSAEIYE